MVVIRRESPPKNGLNSGFFFLHVYMVGYEVDDEPNLYEWGKWLEIATTVRQKTTTGSLGLELVLGFCPFSQVSQRSP